MIILGSVMNMEKMSIMSLCKLGPVYQTCNSRIIQLIVDKNNTEEASKLWMSLADINPKLVNYNISSTQLLEDKKETSIVKHEQYEFIKQYYINIGIVKTDDEFFKLQNKLLTDESTKYMSLLKYHDTVVEKVKQYELKEGQEFLHLVLFTEHLANDIIDRLTEVVKQMLKYKC